MFVPWEIIIGFMAMGIVHWIIQYLRRSDCNEEIRSARNQERRDTIASYREGLHIGMNDKSKIEKELRKGNHEAN